MTKMRDNFSNPNPFLNQVKNYQDLVNQRTPSDSWAESLRQLGNQPANGPQQRRANAMMHGFASGIQGAADQRRQDRLSPILEQAGQITAQAAKIEAQMQQDQNYRLAVNEFGRKYTPLVTEWVDEIKTNGPRMNPMFRGLIDKAAKTIPGFENLVGESWNASGGYGVAIDTQTGKARKIYADEIISAIAPTAQEIYGDRWFEKFIPLNSGFTDEAALTYNMNRTAQNLDIEGKRANIANTYSQANVHNKQAQELDYKMSPQVQEIEKNKKALDYRADHNAKHYIPEISMKFQKNNEVIEGANILKNVLNDTSLTGGSLGKQFARVVATAIGQDEKIVEAKNAGQFYLEWMNDNSKGALSDRDMKAYSKTFADPEKNRAACITILDRLNAKLTKQNNIYTKQLNLYNEDPSANLHNLDLIQSKEKLPQEEGKKTVLMTAPDGSAREVPIDKVEYFKSKGAKIANDKK